MANEDVIKELPEYYAHKPVKAAKLMDAIPTEKAGSWQLIITMPDLSERVLDVDSEWMQHHDPEQGGYVVVGADGQLAYSKSADFEPTFTKDAVVVQKGGKDVFSREHLFELDSKTGQLVPVDVAVIDDTLDLLP